MRLPRHAAGVLAHAVDLAHLEADVAQEVDDLDRDRCGATERDGARVETDRRTQRTERDLVDEGPGRFEVRGQGLATGTQLLHLPAHGERLGEPLLVLHRSRRHSGLDAGDELLENSWRTEQDGGADGDEVPAELGDVGARRDLATPEQMVVM